MLSYSYVDSGSQNYEYNPFVASNLGGTTWKYETQDGHIYYIVFVDGSQFYYIEPASGDLEYQYMTTGIYSKNKSKVTLTFVKNNSTTVTTGEINGNSLTSSGGNITEGIYIKTDNILL